VIDTILRVISERLESQGFECEIPVDAPVAKLQGFSSRGQVTLWWRPGHGLYYRATTSVLGLLELADPQFFDQLDAVTKQIK
jgi:hypothetical protein